MIGRKDLARALCIGAVVSTASWAGPPDMDGGRQLSSDVREALELRDGRVVRPELSPDADGALLAVLPLESVFVPGGLAAIELRPHSARAACYRVLAQRADGSLEPVEPRPVRTFRGSVLGVPDSAVAASLDDNGLVARIMLPTGEVFWLEPIASRAPGALPGEHALYRGEDMDPDEDAACAALDGEGGLEGGSGAGAPPEGSDGGSLSVAELAIDADFEYFQDYGSVAAVEDRINAVINAVNIEFERDVAIRHEITTIIVRTAEPDPYTATNASELGHDFRDHWVAHHADVPRDTAQLFTGKNLDGTTIGWAWYSGICSTTWGYSVTQSDWTSNFAGVTDVSAHEFGHQWSADHCGCANPGYTMNSYQTLANVFHPTDTIPEIIAFRETRTCLDAASGPGSPPAAPSDLVASALSSSEIDLAWTDNAPDEDGLDIERSVEGGAWEHLATLETDADSFQDDGLEPATTYAYRVRAFNAFGDSPYSNVAEATTDDAPPPAAPSDLVATAISPSEIELAWTDNAFDEDGFDVERSVEGGPWELIASPGPDITGFVDNGLSPETACAYSVTAWSDAGGSSSSSNVASATTDPVAPDVASLTDLGIVQGTLLYGGLLQLEGSDNDRLKVKSELLGQKHRTRTVVIASSASASVSALGLTVEASANATPVKIKIELRNFDANKWTRVGASGLANGDTTFDFLEINAPNRFVSAEGTIKVRLTTEGRKKKLPDGYRAKIDLVRLEVSY